LKTNGLILQEAPQLSSEAKETLLKELGDVKLVKVRRNQELKRTDSSDL